MSRSFSHRMEASRLSPFSHYTDAPDAPRSRVDVPTPTAASRFFRASRVFPAQASHDKTLALRDDPCVDCGQARRYCATTHRTFARSRHSADETGFLNVANIQPVAGPSVLRGCFEIARASVAHPRPRALG
jgi:hypothetical protein